jgi:hypothetical protein
MQKGQIDHVQGRRKNKENASTDRRSYELRKNINV